MQKDVEIIHRALKKPVVLVGLMGAGKTKIGGLLAKTLNLPFVDADAEIEKAAGCTIAQMFETQGEPAFRDLERRTIERLMSGDIRIIAPGGGAMMNEQTAALMLGSAITLWLRADLDTLVERTGRTNKRPLLRNGDPREILQGLMDKRYPVYAKAHITVDSEPVTVEENADKTLKALADYLERTHA